MRPFFHGPSSHFRRLTLLFAVAAAVAPEAQAQHDYVGRYDIYSGFTTLSTPYRNLEQRGYHLQTGYNLRTWLSLGFDYSIASGHNTLTPKFLPTALYQELAAQLGLAIALVAVPTDARTQTFAAGPQYQYRRFQRVTLFARPSLGAVRENATAHPKDPLNAAVTQALVPSGHKTDWQGFYGVGGGFDVNATRHVALRLQTDVVYYHLFNDILKDGSWTVRWAVGPSFHFGRNVRVKDRVQGSGGSPTSQSNP